MARLRLRSRKRRLHDDRTFRRNGFYSSLFGNSTTNRISLLFILLILFAFLRYFNLMSKAHLATTNADILESMVGGYQFHNTVNKRTSTSKQPVSLAVESVANSPARNSQKNTNVPLANPTTRQKNGNDDPLDKKGKFAYAFLIGGALSTRPGTDYQGALYSVVVAAHNLRRHGSKAEMVLMVQISATTDATALPQLEEELMRAMNIRLIYLPKAADIKLECFYSLMLEKFRILQLEEYSRVTYLDADILPFCNLDYMMELSETGKLWRENIVMSYKTEPSSGGFFVMKPNATEYEELADLILKVEQKSLEEVEYPHWDPIQGWGHVIDEADPWKTGKRHYFGTNWTFHGAQADQGLLYYWTKYHKKSVSIVRQNYVEHWRKEHSTENVTLQETERDVLNDHLCHSFERDGWTSKAKGPFGNIYHFTGRKKPWFKNHTDLENSIQQKDNHTTFNDYNNDEYWLWLLNDALEISGLRDKISLDFMKAEAKHPSLGVAPSLSQRAQYIWKKKEYGWKQYAKPPRSSKFNSTDTRKWAYAFLLGGARSESKRKTDYAPGLYSVIASAQHLRSLGTRADIVLMVQIAAESPHEKLSDYEEELLQKLNIKIVYLPKFASSKLECFYSLMMEKFRIFKLTEYSRVMYLDYDVMPTCNLDYMFELSDPLPEDIEYGSFRLKETVVLSYQGEPASGGFFIVKPNITDYDNIQRIIHEKETKSLELPYPHWDEAYGWGHVIQSPDYWKDVRGRVGSNWTFYGAEADQGLLYYWAKYVKQSVSIITRDDVEQWDSSNWGTDTNGTLVLVPQGNGKSDVTTIVRKALQSYGCPITHFLPAPYNDFFHLTGRAKPWYQTLEQLRNPNCTEKHVRECNIQGVWYRSLEEALKSINYLDDFSWDFIGTGRGAPLGHAPGFNQIAQYVAAKKEKNWNQYRND